MTDHWKSSLGQHMWKHIWIHGFVIGVGVVLIGFLVWFFITETPSSSTSHPGETAPQVQAPARWQVRLSAPRLLPRPRWIQLRH